MKTTESMDAQVLGWSGLVIATFCLAVMIAGWVPGRWRSGSAALAYQAAPAAVSAAR